MGNKNNRNNLMKFNFNDPFLKEVTNGTLGYIEEKKLRSVQIIFKKFFKRGEFYFQF